MRFPRRHGADERGNRNRFAVSPGSRFRRVIFGISGDARTAGTKCRKGAKTQGTWARSIDRPPHPPWGPKRGHQGGDLAPPGRPLQGPRTAFAGRATRTDCDSLVVLEQTNEGIAIGSPFPPQRGPDRRFSGFSGVSALPVKWTAFGKMDGFREPRFKWTALNGRLCKNPIFWFPKAPKN